MNRHTFLTHNHGHSNHVRGQSPDVASPQTLLASALDGVDDRIARVGLETGRGKESRAEVAGEERVAAAAVR
jgi:hypothetical protein